METAMTAQIIAFPDPLPSPPPLDPAGHALFLDLDGTLAAIAARPGDVGPEPRRTFVLRRLVERFDRRVAIVSGRTVAEVAQITENAVPAIAGVHGLQRRDARGKESGAVADPDLAQALEVFEGLAAAQPGLLVEDKGLSVALHYRARPGACEAIREAGRRLEASTGLVLQEGDMVAEMRTAGDDKGAAVDRFLSEWPFQGAKPIFVGDDLTDEDGFLAAEAAGGYGIVVGVSTRRTIARYRLADPVAVLDWLEAVVGGAR
ncbi:MAG: trehalose-phosphatase [Caulobacter segnis]|uniref:Trehalose 6-phosphate phosphatase n=2 Tax=Caulobacter segnis TaxID=88688 RepID=A0A2W5UZ83_9CAUL|nr:MAG: trehalose-phosphatase [Caulobacter segnis]